MPMPDGISDLESILSQVWPAPHRIRFSTGLGPRGTGQTFGLLPRPHRPTLLVPTSPPRVTARAMRGYKSPTNRAGRLRARALELTARAGAGYLFPWTVTVDGPCGAPSLVAHVEEHLDASLHAAVALGPPRANRKPVLQLIDSSGVPVAFVKVGVNPLTSNRVLVEARALEHLRTLSMPALSVPTIIDLPPWRDTAFLATRPLNTWTSGRVDLEVRGRALRSLATATEPLTSAIRDSEWWLGLTDRLRALDDSAEAQRLRAVRDVLALRVGHLRVPLGPTHGDWSPWNLAVHGSQVSAWDWERFLPRAPMGYDALHYAVQEQIRMRNKPPQEALAAILERAPLIVAQNGTSSDLGGVVFALYLLAQGEQHLTDRQLDAGSERGPISEWLVPVLEQATARLERSAQ